MTQQPFDFCDAIGILVERSQSWQRENGPAFQLGIVVAVNFYAWNPDSGTPYNAKSVAWPWIHWEGALDPSLTHPANAVPHLQRPTAEASKAPTDQDATYLLFGDDLERVELVMRRLFEERRMDGDVMRSMAKTLEVVIRRTREAEWTK